MKPTAIGYLVGAGSMSLGVEQAGFSLQHIYETPGYAKNAKTWTLNRPHMPPTILELDSNYYVPNSSGVDLIYGNPPCGGMSNITGCHVESETNNCMLQWTDMVVKSRPHLILMENAYQIGTKSGTKLREQLLAKLERAGYYAWVWVFYSWQLGCPQHRRRAFVCASLTKPDPKLVDISELDNVKKDSIVVMKWLWNLENVTPQPKPVLTAEGKIVTDHWWDNSAIKISEHLEKYEEIATSMDFLTPRQARKLLATGDPEKIQEYEDAVRNGKYWHDCPQEYQGMAMFRRPCKIPLYGPALTVLSNFKLVHPTRRRLITMRESARLMGYPDEWLFHECKPHLIAQGVPSFNSKWAAKRLLEASGLYHPCPDTLPAA